MLFLNVQLVQCQLTGIGHDSIDEQMHLSNVWEQRSYCLGEIKYVCATAVAQITSCL